MEWYAAFGLALTLVWLYAEIVGMAARARRRRQLGPNWVNAT